jgi:hypothetical protein
LYFLNKKREKEKMDEEIKKKLLRKTKKELLVLCEEKNICTKGSKFDIVHRLCDTNKENVSLVPPKPYTITFHKNFFGNFVHEETGFVFHKETQLVIGKENEKGEIDELTRPDIEICHKWKFGYVLPKYLEDPQKNEYMYEVLLQNPNYTHSSSLEENDEDLANEEEDAQQEDVLESC